MIPYSRTELESRPCTTCGAPPDHPCYTLARNPANRKPTVPHQARWDVARTVRERGSDPVQKQPVTERPLTWHRGTHNWQLHDGMPRHAHSENGQLTIDPHDTGVHFVGGAMFEGETEDTRKVHFIYDASRGTSRREPSLWCSCHVRFGADREAAAQHVRDVLGIPEWLVYITRSIDSGIGQQVTNAMLAHDLDPTDTELYLRYRAWVRRTLATLWA